ncbi:hypothetical protein [Desulfosarcina sp.]|uniref:hypothetical protein n=1 Tax=Desulfosarcina sp. TaxID=2027861 RepID=UPI0029A7960C|nr:hypothetical protein [Desulfosarcina sp.]MDX2451145.1 hypothetical protein [Desulfosarcina sp.]MDX2488984.1 hypothetical protein [Desulfosarcina sp.]
MEIILYRNTNVAGNFEEAIRASFPQITAYTSMTSFCTRLRHTPAQSAIIVLAAADEQELTTLISFRHLIEDSSIVLILPIKESVLLAKAHKLRPRFIGDLESGAHEVIAVIQKMLSREVELKEAEIGNDSVGFH